MVLPIIAVGAVGAAAVGGLVHWIGSREVTKDVQLVGPRGAGKSLLLLRLSEDSSGSVAPSLKPETAAHAEKFDRARLRLQALPGGSDALPALRDNRRRGLVCFVFDVRHTVDPDSESALRLESLAETLRDELRDRPVLLVGTHADRDESTSPTRGPAYQLDVAGRPTVQALRRRLHARDVVATDLQRDEAVDEVTDALCGALSLRRTRSPSQKSADR